MAFIRPVVDEEFARERFSRQRFKRTHRCFRALLGLFSPFFSKRSPASRFHRPLPYAEIVWLPYHHVAIETVQKGKPVVVDILIGGHDRSFVVFDLSTAEFESSPDRERFGPSVDEAEADRIARQGLLRMLLRHPGWGVKPTIGRTQRIELIHYPFWVYYFERRRGLLDVKMLDAVTGQLAGAKSKTAFLSALMSPTDERQQINDNAES